MVRLGTWLPHTIPHGLSQAAMLNCCNDNVIAYTPALIPRRIMP